MTKLGRNDPCRCGSGKKYKKCCLDNDEQSARERLRAAHEQQRNLQAEMRELAARRAARTEHSLPPIVWDEDGFWDDGLDDLSNSVIDLLKQRRYDEALVACERLLRDYPDVADGFERSALVHDALGNHQTAADFWQKALDFIEHPDRRDGYDQELIDDYRQRMLRARERAAQPAAAQPARPDEEDRAP